MRKILLTIQYNGSTFCGWQKQKNLPSVQQVLEDKLEALLGHPVALHASGRTDSGVHAFAQTAHFETTSNFDVQNLPKAINHGLDKNISVLAAKQVSKNFHARFCVKKKTYLYRTYSSQIALPLFESTHAKVSSKCLENFEDIKTAAKQFLGQHNFHAFCAAATQVSNFERTIFAIKIKKTKNTIDFYITGNGFLYNMVRIIVGTLVAVGEGKILPNQIPKIIESQNRKNAGKTMPAHGLYLYKVMY